MPFSVRFLRQQDEDETQSRMHGKKSMQYNFKFDVFEALKKSERSKYLRLLFVPSRDSFFILKSLDAMNVLKLR